MSKNNGFDVSRIPFYQSGAEGFIAFVEENVRFCVPQPNSPVPRWVYPTQLSDMPDPITGRTFKQMWEEQKIILREALQMKDGKFKYRLIVFCWPRGEGKSFMVCLIQLWKFFCFPRQLIVFGALSKDQTKFVHYEMIQSVLLNSPKLVGVIGKANIQRGQTFLKNSKGETVSSFQPISTYSGIVSNITGYTFSEMFDMKDPKFFVQLDGSVRNIINALGTIDSTVSVKEHILYRLYKGTLDGSDRLTYFSYRSAHNASSDEYWHPLMTKEQLDSYRKKFPPADFDRYFRNVWELESGKLFSESVIKSIFYFGINKESPQIDKGEVLNIFTKIHEYEIKIDKHDYRKNQLSKGARFPEKRRRKFKDDYQQLIVNEHKKLVPMDNYYKLHSLSMPKLASIEDLNNMSDIYNTHWGIHVGLDRADPMARDPLARTILTCVAKGLIGSRNKVEFGNEIPTYLYLLLHLAWVEDSTLEGIKSELQSCYIEYDGIDTLCSERWGTWDLAPWCEEHEVKFEPLFPSYNIQKKAFNELYNIVQDARLKSPHIIIPGSQTENILAEEFKMFDYHPDKKWYGSPQKMEVQGVQDDSIYALAWAIYGGREVGYDSFRLRKGSSFFGNFIPDERRLTYGL